MPSIEGHVFLIIYSVQNPTQTHELSKCYAKTSSSLALVPIISYYTRTNYKNQYYVLKTSSLGVHKYFLCPPSQVLAPKTPMVSQKTNLLNPLALDDNRVISSSQTRGIHKSNNLSLTIKYYYYYKLRVCTSIVVVTIPTIFHNSTFPQAYSISCTLFVYMFISQLHGKVVKIKHLGFSSIQAAIEGDTIVARMQ